MTKAKANEATEVHFLDVGLQVRDFEEKTDRALGSGGQLLHMLTEKRLELGISGPSSQEIIAQVVSSIAALATGRERGCASHLGLKELRDRYRMNPRAEGDCCGDPRFFTSASADRQLRAVE